MIAQIVVFFSRKTDARIERKILRFVPQKLRKSFANGNPISKKKQFYSFAIEFVQILMLMLKLFLNMLELRSSSSLKSRIWKDILAKNSGITFISRTHSLMVFV